MLSIWLKTYIFFYIRIVKEQKKSDDLPLFPPETQTLLQNEKMVEVNGFEPMASCVQGRRSPN
jgi:hypothetical protein